MKTNSDRRPSALDLVRLLDNRWLDTEISPFEDPWYRFAQVIRAVLQMTDIRSGDRWLDLGCHQGQFLTVLASLFNVSGLGIDDWDLSQRTGVQAWDYMSGNLAQPIHVNERFQFVSALEVLEHMIDTDSFLRECNRLLEPGGHLVISTPNINSLRNRITVPLGIYPNGLEYKNRIHHVRLYNLSNLSSHLGEYGFVPLVKWGVNMIPVRYLANAQLLKLSEYLCPRLPQFANNFIVVAQKQG